MRFVLPALAVGISLCACSGDGDSVGPAATSIVGVAGLDQTGIVAQPVPVQPQVRVTDGLGKPVADVSVTFEIGLGSGSVSHEAQITNADGIATAPGWTLGTLDGPNVLLAQAAGLEGSPVSFNVTALAGPAAELESHAGDGQFAHVGTAVIAAPEVLVIDAYGNPVAGAIVDFEVTSGGGTVAGGVQTTPETGVARAGSWTLGAHPGTNTLVASSAGLIGSPLSFNATGLKGVAIEVRNNYFHSLHNGSGGPGEFPFDNPALDTIAVGETVTWIWEGQGHNVSSLSTSGTHDAPHTFSVTFNAPGFYSYVCKNHSQFVPDLGVLGMRGVITVH